MITREQAVLARDSLVAVFGPDGMEVTVLVVSTKGDAVIGVDNWGQNRNVYRFDELDPSRSILALQNKA